MRADKNIEEMTAEELRGELDYAKECLLDLEETYEFYFARTSAHIGGATAAAMREEHEEHRARYAERIVRIETLLREKGGK